MEISLELLDESDFSQIVQWVNLHSADFLVQWAGLTYEYPLTIEQMKIHYRRGMNTPASDVFVYRIMRNNHFIGTVQLCRFNPDRKQAFIARFLIGEEQNRGQGVGKKALKQLVRIGFEQFGLESIHLNVFDHNEQAIRCYESIGFRKGHYHENRYQDSNGLWWGNYVMTLRKEDWLIYLRKAGASRT